jgi:hypothetical protein
VRGSGRRSSARAALAAVALVAALLPVTTSSTASAVTPTPRTLSPVLDAPPSYEGQVLCTPAPKPGTRKLAALLLATYGKASVGISRACSIGGTSEHKEGRALDWMVSWKVPAQRAKAQAFLAWLLAPDADGNPAAMARRLGVMYLGWDNQFWAGYDIASGWTDLKGCTTDPAKKAAGYDTYCHRNHVHISLSWDGAAGLTSYWSGIPVPQPCQAPWSSPHTLAGPSTDLVAISPVRVLDTRAGTGLDAPCRLSAGESWDPTHHDVVVPVTGVGGAAGVPAEGVAAVAVRVTVSRPSAPVPTVVVRSTASSPPIRLTTSVSTGAYGTTTIVPVASDGTIRLGIDRGGADVTVDVVGWAPLPVVAPDPTPTPDPSLTPDPSVTPTPDPSASPSVTPDPTASPSVSPSPTPTTYVDPGGLVHVTRTTLVYRPAAPLAPGETRTVSLAGIGPVPSTGLAGLQLTLTAGASRTSDSVGILTPSGRSYLGMLRTSTTVARSTQALVPTTTGTVVLRNAGTTAVPVRLEVTGWYAAAPARSGQHLVLLARPATVVDTGRRIGLTGPTTSGAVRAVTLPAPAVPAGALGVLLAVDALGGRTDSTLALGSTSTVQAVSFLHGQWAHETVLVQLRPDRLLALRTVSIGTQVRVTVLGYLR